MVKDFLYTPAILAALGDTVSTERLTPYRKATGDDPAAALRLYAWNAAISATLYVPLQSVEIKYPSRNSCTIRLCSEQKTALITYQKLWSGTYTP